MDNVGHDGGPFGLFLLCVFLFGMFFRALIESGCLQEKPTVKKKPKPKPKPKPKSKSKSYLESKVERLEARLRTVESVKPKTRPEAKPKPKPEPKPKPKPKPKPEPKPTTDPLVKEDVIQALVGLGYKKTQSSKIVNDLADKKEYTDAEILLRDILSGKR